MRSAALVLLALAGSAAVAGTALGHRTGGPTATISYSGHTAEVVVKNGGAAALTDIIVKSTDSPKITGVKCSSGKCETGSDSYTSQGKKHNEYRAEWKGSLAAGKSVEIDLTTDGGGQLAVYTSVNGVFTQVPTTIEGGGGGGGSTTTTHTTTAETGGADVQVDVKPIEFGFRVTIKNNGPMVAKSISAAAHIEHGSGDLLLAGVHQAKALASRGIVVVFSKRGRGGLERAEWRIPSLAPGRKIVVDLLIRDATPDKGESLVAVATADARTDDPNPHNNKDTATIRH